MTARVARRRSARRSDTTARRWRQDSRVDAVRSAIDATKGIQWNHHLVDAILDELYVDDHFEEILAREPGRLRPREYPRAIAIALILRHSWQPGDLAWIRNRLKVGVAKAELRESRRKVG